MRNLRFACLACALTASAASLADDMTRPVLLKPQQLTVPVEAEALQRQYDALSAMPNIKVRYSRQGTVNLLMGPTPIALDAPRDGKHDTQLAREVMRKFRDVLLATGRETLTLIHSDELGQVGFPPNRRSLTFSESIGSIEVVEGFVLVQIEEPYGMVTAVSATFLADRNLPRAPKLSVADAQRKIVEALEATSEATTGSVVLRSVNRLAYYGGHPDARRGQLVWVLDGRYMDELKQQFYERFYADAFDGMVAARHAQVTDGPVHRYEFNKDCVPAPQNPAAGEYRGCAGLPQRAVISGSGKGCKHRVRWEPVPGATTYNAELVPVAYGWAFTRTVVDGFYNACTIDVPRRSELYVRACNGCGCSDWSEPLLLDSDC